MSDVLTSRNSALTAEAVRGLNCNWPNKAIFLWYLVMIEMITILWFVKYCDVTEIDCSSAKACPRKKKSAPHFMNLYCKKKAQVQAERPISTVINHPHWQTINKLFIPVYIQSELAKSKFLWTEIAVDLNYSCNHEANSFRISVITYWNLVYSNWYDVITQQLWYFTVSTLTVAAL